MSEFSDEMPLDCGETQDGLSLSFHAHNNLQRHILAHSHSTLHKRLDSQTADSPILAIGTNSQIIRRRIADTYYICRGGIKKRAIDKDGQLLFCSMGN